MAEGEENIELDEISRDHDNNGYDADETTGLLRGEEIQTTSTSQRKGRQRKTAETSFMAGLETTFGPRQKFNEQNRMDVKRLFPEMGDSVEVGMDKGRLSVRIFGEDDD